MHEQVLDELRGYFQSKFGDVFPVSDIRAQSFEYSGGAPYHPNTDTRMVTMMRRSVGRSAWGKIRQALDELPEDVVTALRLACRGRATLATRLPKARAAGRVLAELEARTTMLEDVRRAMVASGRSPMTVAMRVLEADIHRLPPVSEAAVESATYWGVDGGEIVVDAEIDAAIDAAVKAFVAVRERLRSARRERRERIERENQAFIDSMNSDKEAKRRARFEARLRRAS